MYGFTYTEGNIKKIIEYQRKYWADRGIEPNCLALGSETLNLFIVKGWLEQKEDERGMKLTYYEDLMVYVDGWEPVAISVFYNPFYNDYFKDAEPGSIGPLDSLFEVAEMPVEEDGAETKEE